jgi:hypothetical protein
VFYYIHAWYVCKTFVLYSGIEVPFRISGKMYRTEILSVGRREIILFLCKLEVLYCYLSLQVNKVGHPSGLSIKYLKLYETPSHTDLRWQFVIVFIKYYILWLTHYRKISMQEWVWSRHTL